MDAQGVEALVFRLQRPPELQVQKTSVFQFCDSAEQRMNGRVDGATGCRRGRGENRKDSELCSLPTRGYST